MGPSGPATSLRGNVLGTDHDRVAGGEGSGERERKGAESLLKEITAENFPNQGKETFRPRKAREFQWNPNSSIPTLTLIDLH